jgi:hypothetical protein
MCGAVSVLVWALGCMTLNVDVGVYDNRHEWRRINTLFLASCLRTAFSYIEEFPLNVSLHILFKIVLLR